jgi:mRNA-degrading endonuclease toxin of MazEF toxin-antitoxin module
MVIERFDIFLVRLDPTTGAETAKTRPCVVVSPNELNRRHRHRHYCADDHCAARLAHAN